ncbi:hypothetical protein DL765_011773, partial [Monosporascus sp. GIB2]
QPVLSSRMCLARISSQSVTSPSQTSSTRPPPSRPPASTTPVVERPAAAPCASICYSSGTATAAEPGIRAMMSRWRTVMTSSRRASVMRRKSLGRRGRMLPVTAMTARRRMATSKGHV